MKKFISKSYEETVAFAREFARSLPPGSLIAYLGDLGMGKTAFTAGLVKGLGIECDVSSPTFAICNSYIGEKKTLHHFDMYRVDNWDDLYSTGFFDYLDTEDYIAVEWSENIYAVLPDYAIMIEIKKLSDEEREFHIFKKREKDDAVIN